ncbi:MAG TPA: DUF5668 domain-containing protein [Candidatus Paceibacterota bacterium]|nr:DUF5668 domain-containing protein [Candidatus Paceibacterota bacterium]
MDEDNNKDRDFYHSNSFWYGRILPGMWMLVIGIIFLLNNFGFLQNDAWGKLWPLFIIIPALFMIFRPHRHR